MSAIRIDSQAIAAVLDRNLREHAVAFGPHEIGHVVDAADGIARVSGLPGLMVEEMVLFPDDVYGMALNLERDHVGVVVLGEYDGIEQGSVVKRTGKVLQVPVGEGLLGRVVNPLGLPLDGGGPVRAAAYRYVEHGAPGIVDRESVSRPLQTGLKSIDAMTAIGRGQRELIVGDRQTGKTTVVLDTILNQTPGDVRCVYVAIGQRMSSVSVLVETLRRHDALRNCIVVAATASDSAPLRYIAPFAGCAMAEHFRDAGGDALIVYDDLSKHAVAYREISLLLRRSPGREAYPGDIFYLHSRLLERAAKLSPAKGGGSLTALPIVETQQGDYSAYIPTNLISITDGQIYLDGDLFHQGFRPAINVGLSVSRVGGKAQSKAMRKVAIQLRMELAQYREIAAFAELTTDLDKATLRQLHRGERLVEILKQRPNAPMPVHRQIASLWAATRGHLDSVALCDVARFEAEWHTLLDEAHPDVGRQIVASGDVTPEIEAALEQAMAGFGRLFVGTAPAETLSRDRIVPKEDDTDHRVAGTMIAAG
jgi:F-type H+-transporting ATPase subunit alpha